jgi:hypothetical protein
MTRRMTADFAKSVAQTAIGQSLHSHFGLPDGFLLSFTPFRSRVDRQDAQRAAARYPSKSSQIQNRAESRPTDVPKSGVAGDSGKGGVPTGNQLRRKACALLTRAEEVRAAAETMQAPDAREAMLRIAATYEKIARSFMKSPDTLKDPTSEIT